MFFPDFYFTANKTSPCHISFFTPKLNIFWILITSLLGNVLTL